MSITAFPSTDGWITSRTREVQLTDQNCAIIVDKKIDYVEKLLVDATTAIIGVEYRRLDENGDIVETDGVAWTTMPVSSLNIQSDVFAGNLTELDITASVVEISKWKTLDLQNKSVSFIYETKTNEISVSNYWKDALGIEIEPAIDMAIYKAMKYYEDNNGIFTFQRTIVENGVQKNVYYVATVSLWQTRGANDIVAMRFRVLYEPLGENVKLNVLKQVPEKNEFAIPFSQQQQIVNNLALGRNMQATANRTGVGVRTICRRVNSIDKVRQIGSVWKDTQGNKWRLTAQNIDFSCGYANCVETWSKNWAMQSEFVGINREFRSWNIPADTVKRNLLVEDYCYLTEENDFGNANSSRLTDLGKNLVVSSFNTSFTSAVGTEATQLEIQTRKILQGNTSTIEPKGVLAVSSFGFGNSVVFSATTKDNLSLGIQRIESIDDGRENKRYCQDCYYTDNNGRIDAVDLRFGNKLTNIDTNLYPQTTRRGYQNAEADANTVEQEDLLVYIDRLKIYKDESEQLGFTYQLHFLTHVQDIVLGAGLGSNILLAKNRGANELKYWALTSDLPQGASVMTSQWGTSRAYTPITTVGSNYIIIQGKTCLTDSKNNVIIANNGNSQKLLYFNFTQNYDAMQEYYDSKYGSQYRDAIAQ